MSSTNGSWQKVEGLVVFVDDFFVTGKRIALFAVFFPLLGFVAVWELGCFLLSGFVTVGF